jgi:flagellar biosynthesis/type III secretory pathway protein FliH
MQIVYVGPHDGVEVLEIPDPPIVQPNTPIDVPDDIANRLLQQTENWARPESSKERAAREKREADTAEQEAAAVAAAEQAADEARKRVAAEQAKREGTK